MAIDPESSQSSAEEVGRTSNLPVDSLSTPVGAESFPMADQDLAELLSRIRQGDESAVGELFHRYERAVLRTVRRRLGNEMRRVMDSMDVLQSVHRSLLVGVRAERFRFATPQQLVALAVVIAQRKISRHWRKLKRSPVTGIGDGTGGDSTTLEDISSPDPTPCETALADDLLEKTLSQLDELDRCLMRLKLDGHSTVETAALLGRDPAFIRMRWSRIRQRLRERD